MKYAIQGIIVACIVAMSFSVVSGQILVDSYGQYLNKDKSIERVITFKNRGYAYVEGVTTEQSYEVFFPEGPNEQKNGTHPLLANIWIAVHIRDIMTRENSACFHYYAVKADKSLEYKCSGRKQINASIDSLPANIRKGLSDFRNQAKVIWPGVKFPE